MLTNHSTTGIKIVKKTGEKATNSFKPKELTTEIIFEGQAIISDHTDQSTTTLTPYGISKLQGFTVHIDADLATISKQDCNYLELSFNEPDLHEEKDFVATPNNILLKVIDVFKPNHILLNYITLICEI